MKRRITDYFLSRERDYDRYQSFVNLLLRCFAGLMMIPYGVNKIEEYDKYVNDFFGDPIGLGNVPSLWLTMFAQLGCSVTLVLGIQSRASAAILAFCMLVAAKYHFFDPFATVSLPVLFLAIYLVLLMWGAGKYSLDYKLFSSRRDRRYTLSENLGLLCVAAAFAVMCVVFAHLVGGTMSVVLSAVALLLFFLAYNFITDRANG